MNESGLQQLCVWAAFFFGVVIADQFIVTERFYIVGLCFAFATGLLWRVGRANALFYSLVAVVMLLGVVRMEWAEHQFSNSIFTTHVGTEVTLTGQVAREPDERESSTQLYVQVEDELLLVRIDRFTPVQYGDQVTVVGSLERAEPFLTDTGRVFDYPNYLQTRGVQYVVSFAQVEVAETGGGNPLVRLLLRAKQQFADAINGALAPPQSDLGLGLLLGIKQNLGDDLEDAFRRTGLIHIVVLSGYNVMLVIAFFWWVTSWVLPLRGRVLASVVGIVLFAIMVGLSATVVRASIMAGILLLAKYIGARYDVLRALLFAGLVMVVLNPYLLLYDLGFQLSFMATLGLVLSLPLFEADLATQTKQVRLRDIFLATVTTQVFVLPLLIFHIGEVSLVAVVVNVLVLPVVAAAMALTFAAGLFALVSPALAWPLAFLANLVLSYIIVVVTWFDGLSWAAASLAPISVWEMLGLHGLIGIGWYAWQRRQETQLVALEPDQLAGWEIVEDASDEQGGGQNEDGADLAPAKSAPSEPPVFLR